MNLLEKLDYVKEVSSDLDYIKIYDNCEETFHELYGEDLMSLAQGVAYGNYYSKFDPYIVVGEVYGEIDSFSKEHLNVYLNSMADEINEVYEKVCK